MALAPQHFRHKLLDKISKIAEQNKYDVKQFVFDHQIEVVRFQPCETLAQVKPQDIHVNSFAQILAESLPENDLCRIEISTVCKKQTVFEDPLDSEQEPDLYPHVKIVIKH